MEGMQIVEEARSWIGTKFHHQGRLKKEGRNSGAVDCIGLLIGVAENLGIKSQRLNNKGERIAFSQLDRITYAREPNGKLLKESLDYFLEEIDSSEIQAGDILLFTLARFPQHVAIVGNYAYGGFSIIHAYSPAGFVCEHILCNKWKRRITTAYRFKI